MAALSIPVELDLDLAHRVDMDLLAGRPHHGGGQGHLHALALGPRREETHLGRRAVEGVDIDLVVLVGARAPAVLDAGDDPGAVEVRGGVAFEGEAMGGGEIGTAALTLGHEGAAPLLPQDERGLFLGPGPPGEEEGPVVLVDLEVARRRTGGEHGYRLGSSTGRGLGRREGLIRGGRAAERDGGPLGVVVSVGRRGGLDDAARGKLGDLVHGRGLGLLRGQEMKGRRGRGGSARLQGGGFVPADGWIERGVVAEDHRVSRDERVGRERGRERRALDEGEVEARFGAEALHEAEVALLVLGAILPRRVIAEQPKAGADARFPQDRSEDLGHPEVLEDPGALSSLEQPETGDEAKVVLHAAAAGLVYGGEPDGGDDAIEGALASLGGPDEARRAAEGDALHLVVVRGLDGSDDVEAVRLRYGLVTGEGLDPEVVGRETLQGEVIEVVAWGGGE